MPTLVSAIQFRNQKTVNMFSSNLYQRYKSELIKQLICPALVCIRDTNQKLENNQHAQLQFVLEIQTRNQKTISMSSSSLYERYKPETRKQLTCPALVCIRDTNQKLENNQHAQLQSVSEIQTRNQKTMKETSALKRWFIRCTARNFRFIERVMYSINIQPDCKTCAVHQMNNPFLGWLLWQTYFDPPLVKHVRVTIVRIMQILYLHLQLKQLDTQFSAITMRISTSSLLGQICKRYRCESDMPLCKGWIT